MEELDLSVTPEYLSQLAEKQDRAADQIGFAAKATNGIGKKVSVSHGVVCTATNEAVVDAEAARRAAARAMREGSTGLAEKLRNAATTYKGADLDAASNLDSQIR